MEEEEKVEDNNKKKKTVKVTPLNEYHGDNPNSDAACFFQAKYDEKRFEERRSRKA